MTRKEGRGETGQEMEGKEWRRRGEGGQEPRGGEMEEGMERGNKADRRREIAHYLVFPSKQGTPYC